MMGQMNQLDETLAIIRRQKSLYKKRLENVHTIDARNRLKEDIDALSEEESKLLDQLKCYGSY